MRTVKGWKVTCVPTTGRNGGRCRKEMTLKDSQENDAITEERELFLQFHLLSPGELQSGPDCPVHCETCLSKLPTRRGCPVSGYFTRGKTRNERLRGQSDDIRNGNEVSKPENSSVK